MPACNRYNHREGANALENRFIQTRPMEKEKGKEKDILRQKLQSGDQRL